MFGCLFFTFLTMIELAVANLVEKWWEAGDRRRPQEKLFLARASRSIP